MWLTWLITWLLAAPTVWGETIGHVTRDYFGDIFTLGDCDPEACDKGGRRAAHIPGERCRCQCAPSHYTFREDMKQCIKDVGECPVAMFVRPFAVERIPLVFLPMTGQLVYPGAHLTVSGIARLAPSRHLSCNVKTSLLMTSHGWQPIRTPSHIFGVYYDGNKTFLQWLGDDEDRRRLQHHLVLIRLMCEGETSNGTFEPCAALRIGWAPGLEPEVAESVPGKNNNYIIIGLCLGILGLIYVGAVLIYLKVRKGRRSGSRQALASPATVEAPEDEDARGTSQVRSSYINNLVQEAELTSQKSSGKGLGTADPGPSTSDASQASDQIASGKSTSTPGGHMTSSLFDKQPIEGGSSPDNLPSQPPTQEFFLRIRGVISAAKNRLNNFRYRPTLLVIPEDDYFYQDFKERDMEVTGERKSLGRYRKGGSIWSSKTESIHGSHLGAAMLEAKLAPPLPPPRHVRPKSKKRAPSPPGSSRQSLSERSDSASPPVKPSSRGEYGDSMDYGGGHDAPINGDTCTKFDLFRLDLYEKIKRMQDGERENFLMGLDNDMTVLEVIDGQRTQDRVGDQDELVKEVQHQKDGLGVLQYNDGSLASQSHGKISRRQLLYRLQEEEIVSVSDRENESSKKPASSDSNVDDQEEEEENDWASSRAGSVVEEAPTISTNAIHSSRPSTASSTSSTHTSSSHPSTLKEKVSPVHDSKKQNDAELSDGSEGSLSGDSLNSSFRKPKKSVSSLKSEKSQKSTEEMSIISASSMITSSTAIREMEEDDDDDDETQEEEEDDDEDDLQDDDDEDELQDDEDEDELQDDDDDSRMSTDIDPEDETLSESEHPSLEEYLQLSSQVAKKLSERTVPAFSGNSQREKNVLSQFMKEFKTTIGRLRTTEDVKPKSHRAASPGADNWTLKKEEKSKSKVSRKVSIFKRNPLKSKKNEEPLVSDDSHIRSGHYTINGASETDDTASCISSHSSIMGFGKSRYKSKSPEIVPASRVVGSGEKTVISITNNTTQTRIIEKNGVPPTTAISGIMHSRNGKVSSSPPELPPKPRPDQIKITAKLRKGELETSPHQELIRKPLTVVNGSTGSKLAKGQKALKKNSKNSKTPVRYVRTPSIESDSISVANSDMTEDSLNSAGPVGETDGSHHESSEDESPIDRCLAQLADSVIQPPDDSSLNRYLSQLGTVLAAREECPLEQCLNKLASNMNGSRATKGFNVSQHLPLGTWEHVCLDARSSDRSTPTSDRSSTSRGSRNSQENLRKKALTKSKHHHHNRQSECKHSNGDAVSVPEIQQILQGNHVAGHLTNGHNHSPKTRSPLPNGGDAYSPCIQVERSAKQGSSHSRVTSTSEEEDDTRTSSVGSSREPETPLSETTSDISSADVDRPRKKRPLVRRTKKGLNGTCRQHILNNRLGKGESGKKGGVQARQPSNQRTENGDVTVIQLEGQPTEHVTNVDSSNTFVTLISVDSSDCSNSAEEK